MESNGTARVHYFDRQFLRSADFADEQAYHVAMRRRHNIAQHTWGIVEGLDLKAEEDGAFVQPGYAIDGYGRDVILPRRERLPVEEFENKRTDVLDVWIVYGRDMSNLAPPGYAGCGPNAGAQYRLPEAPSLRLEKPDISYPDPRQPKGVPPGDYQFSATRLPPDDPNTIWPVFLGQLTRTADPKNPYSVNRAKRPYAGLAGESVIAPSGKTCLQIGQPFRKNDPPGFAVFIPAEAAEDQEPKLQIDDEKDITLRGDATVFGNVKLPQGALEFSAANVVNPPDGVLAPPQPWKIYVARGDNGETELRIEMGAGASGKNLVSVGAFSDDEKKFSPCLTLDDQCTVTIEKDLVIGRSITNLDGSIPEVVSAGLSKEVRDFVLSSMMSGIGGSSAVLESIFKPSAPKPTALEMASQLAISDPDRQAFIDIVKTHFPGLQTELKTKL